MLSDLFLTVWDLSRAACPVILCVVILRLLLSRKPKVLSYALWAVVLVRLLCPVLPQAPVGLVQRAPATAERYTLQQVPMGLPETARAVYHAASNVLDGQVEPQHILTAQRDAYGSRSYVTADWWEVWALTGSRLWPVGAGLMALYGLWSYGRLRRSLVGSARVEGNVWECDRIATPFVCGLLRPRIYLPSTLTGQQRDYVLRHERHHLKRYDHVTRWLSYLALCIHWFNPLVWLAFWLAGRDMEMSCDEAVIGRMGDGLRAEYAASLLHLADRGHGPAPTPLAFGAGSVSARIRNLARWKKPAGGLLIALCILLAVVLVVDRAAPAEAAASAGDIPQGRILDVKQMVYQSPLYSSLLIPGQNTAQYCYTSDRYLWSRDGDQPWRCMGQARDLALDEENFDDLFMPVTAITSEAARIRRDNAQSWKLLDGTGRFSYLLLQKDGTVLLAVGYTDGAAHDGVITAPHSIRWLMELQPGEPINESLLTAPQVLPSDLQQFGQVLSGPQRAMAVQFPVGTTPAQALEYLSWVEISPRAGEGAPFRLYREDQPVNVLFTLYDAETLTPQLRLDEHGILQTAWPAAQLLEQTRPDRQYIVGTDTEQGPVYFGIHLLPVPVAVIDGAILARYADPAHGEGCVHVQSHVVLGQTVSGDRTTVYVVLLDAHYSYPKCGLLRDAYTYLPAAITFETDEHDEYRVTDFWEGEARYQAGSSTVRDRLWPSVTERFPLDALTVELTAEDLDFTGYFGMLEEDCDLQAGYIVFGEDYQSIEP